MPSYSMSAGNTCFEEALSATLYVGSVNDPPETDLEYYAKPENYTGSNLHSIQRLVFAQKKKLGTDSPISSSSAGITQVNNFIQNEEKIEEPFQDNPLLNNSYKDSNESPSTAFIKEQIIKKDAAFLQTGLHDVSNKKDTRSSARGIEPLPLSDRSRTYVTQPTSPTSPVTINIISPNTPPNLTPTNQRKSPRRRRTESDVYQTDSEDETTYENRRRKSVDEDRGPSRPRRGKRFNIG